MKGDIRLSKSVNLNKTKNPGSSQCEPLQQ